MGEDKETIVREEQAALPGWPSRRKLVFVGMAVTAFALIYWLLPVDDTDTHTDIDTDTDVDDVDDIDNCGDIDDDNSENEGQKGRKER